MEAGQRPKRRCVKRKTALPSAVHYVGYVEDDETPEMIMRKFEELERVMAGANAHQPLAPQATAGASTSAPAHAAAGCPASDSGGLEQAPTAVARTNWEAVSTSGTVVTAAAPSSEVHLAPGDAAGAAGPLTCAQGGGVDPTAEAAASAQQQHHEDLLLEVFKRTSYFNVRSVVQDSEAQAAARFGGSADDPLASMPGGGTWWDACSSDTDLDHQLGFWSDDEDCGSDSGAGVGAGTSGGSGGERKAGAGGRKGGGGGGRRQQARTAGGPEPASATGRAGGNAGVGGSARERHMRHHVLIQYNRDTNALIRRKARPVLKDGIFELRVPPPPLPTAWGRTIAPYDPTLLEASMESLGLEEAAPAAATGRGTRAATGAAVGAGRGAGARVPGAGTNAGSGGRPMNGVVDGAGTGAGEGMGQGDDRGTAYHEAADVVQAATSRAVMRAYQAVLINAGWEIGAEGGGGTGGTGGGGAASAVWADRGGGDARLMDRFRSLPLLRLCPSGFVFVWARKQHIHPITKQLHAWGYIYVENLTWVWLAANNSVAREAYPYARRSHLTLLIFRKEGEGKDIELKHQRSPDVVFDCVRATPGCAWEVPQEVYAIMETMLPTGRGRFLELWASRSFCRRAGWTRVVEVGRGTR